MGYTKTTLNLLKLLKDENLQNKTIIEFGSQDIEVNIDELNNFINYFDKKPLKLESYIKYNHSRLSTKYLYDSISCKSYDCIDIDGVHDSLKFDLNYNINDKYDFSEKYDIVTNLGTSEHIFNQYSCFENIHNLCKQNGFIIISLPIEGYSNHCFFNYHPTFFQHLAKANNYEVLYLDYCNTSYHNEDDSKNINIIYKKLDDEKFVMPIQNTIDKAVKKIDKLSGNILKNNFLKLTNIDLDEIKSIGIFGTAQAGENAYIFTQKIDKKVLCFIDDSNTGMFRDTNIPIVSYEQFVHTYQNSVDLILQGNKQKGELTNRDNLSTKLIELSSLIYSIEK